MDADGAAAFEQAPAGAYDRFVGRYGPSLSAEHLAAAGAHHGQRALDVGCGPGPLTRALADLLGPESVAAVDPSAAFVDECRRRVPEADVRVATAERLPSYDEPFDLVTSQLVVNFMDDAHAGVAAMRAAAKPGGTVISAVWDYAEGMTLLHAFWEAAREHDPEAPDEGLRMRFCTRDALARLWRDSGLGDVDTGELTASAAYSTFDDLWEPFTAGIGPAGAYCVSLDEGGRERLRAALHRRLRVPDGPFELEARAWFVRGTA